MGRVYIPAQLPMKLLLILVLMLITLPLFADELQIPFSCWPKELVSEFSSVGKKLDLRSEDRTKESWGYIVNKGSSFSIFTYKSVTQEDFKNLQNIVFKIEKAHVKDNSHHDHR